MVGGELGAWYKTELIKLNHKSGGCVVLWKPKESLIFYGPSGLKRNCCVLLAPGPHIRNAGREIGQAGGNGNAPKVFAATVEPSNWSPVTSPQKSEAHGHTSTFSIPIFPTTFPS